MRIAIDKGGVWIVGRASCKRFKILELLKTSTNVMPNESAPELTLGECSHFEIGYNPKIVRAAFECLKEVRVGG